MFSGKGATPLALIFSLVITVVGIGLVFTLLGDRLGASQEMYCKSAYGVRKMMGGYSSICEDYLSVYAVGSRSADLVHFSDGRKAKVWQFSGKGNVSFFLPQMSKINHANMTLSLVPQMINNFTDGSTYKKFVFNDDSYEEDITSLPTSAIVTDAKFELSGSIYPSSLNIAYVVDTSSSMSDEWVGICASRNSIQRSLLNLGLDSTFLVFAMESNLPNYLRMKDNSFPKDCIDDWIQPEEMHTASGIYGSDLTLLIEGSWNCECTSKVYFNNFDSIEEAWALGGAAVMNRDVWSDDSATRRIVIPVSDSDPTGAVWKWVGSPCVSGVCGTADEPSTAGTEGDAVNRLIGAAEGNNNNGLSFNVLPIFGNDVDNSELFRSGRNDCMPEYDADGNYFAGSRICDTGIYKWMDKIATAENVGVGFFSGFADIAKLQDDILRLTEIPFPSDIDFEFKCGSSIISGSWSGELNLSNGPWILIADDSSLGDIGGSCSVEISAETGALVLGRIRIWYLQPQSGSIKVKGQPEKNFNLHESNRAEAFDLTLDIQSQIDDCTSDPCEIFIEVDSSDDGYLMLSNLSISYTYYDIKEEILDKVLECWTLSNHGTAVKDMTCSEITVPLIYEYTGTINETHISELMLRRNLCHIIANSDFGCGTKDQLTVKSINDARNILIEYSGRNHHITVS